MTTQDNLQSRRRNLHEQIEALAKKKQPQAASGRFALALFIAGLVLFGGLAATFYASAAQREDVLAKGTSGVFNTVVDGANQVQVNNFHQ